MHKTISPVSPSQLWKYVAISLLNIPHFPTLGWNPRSFFHFFLLQSHAMNFYPGTSAMSVRSLFPLALQQCSGTPVLAFSFLRNLSTSITPSVTISFILTLFLVVNSLILIFRPGQAVLNEDTKIMFVYFIKNSTQSPAKQCFLRKYQVIELSPFPASLKKKIPKFIKTFFGYNCIQKGLSAVLCVTAQFGEKPSYKAELSLLYSVSTFHYHTVSFGYCSWLIMNRRLKQGIFLSFFRIIKFNYVHYSRIDISLQLPLSLSLFHSSVYPQL